VKRVQVESRSPSSADVLRAVAFQLKASAARSPQRLRAITPAVFREPIREASTLCRRSRRIKGGWKGGLMPVRGGVVRSAVAFFSFALAVLILIPVGAHAGCSASPDDGCPLKINNQVVFDRCFGAPPVGPDAGRPTRVGNQICDILRDTNVVARRIGAGAQSLQNSAQRDIEAFAKVTFDGAIDQDALNKFNDTNRLLRLIENDVQTFRNDRQCGDKAAMEALEKSFKAEVQQLRLLGEAIGKTADAAAAMAPAAGEAVNIAAEVATLGELAGRSSDNAVKLHRQLYQTVESLGKTAAELSKLDVAGAVNAGGAVVTGIAPFITDCAGCAGAIAGAAGSLGGGGTAVAGGTAGCGPSAGGGCAAGAAGGGLGAAGTALSLVLGSPACTGAAAKAAEMGNNVEKVRKFFETVTKLIDTMDKTVKSLEKTSKELALLYKEIGNQAKPSVDRIGASLDKASVALDNGKKILRDQVVPRMQKYVGNRFQIMADQADQLLYCYNNIQRLAGSITGDVVSAAADMGQAAVNIVDAGRVLQNLSRQGVSAISAGRDYASREWKACENEEKALHKALWGVDRGIFDPGKTAPHLADLATHPDRIPPIAGRVAGLKAKEANIALKAVDEGKKAYLNLDQSKSAAGSKFGDAERLASAAARKIAKSKAKAEAKQGAAKSGASAPASRAVVVKPAPMPAPNTEALKPSQPGK